MKNLIVQTILSSVILFALYTCVFGSEEKKKLFQREAFTVVDADTIKDGLIYYRLIGYDAFESWQKCKVRGKPISCGLVAKLFFTELTNKGMMCKVLNEKDYFNRVLIHECISNKTKRDVAEVMVEEGFGFINPKYFSPYKDHQKLAKKESRGFWCKGCLFKFPWEYNKRTRELKKYIDLEAMDDMHKAK